MKKMIDFHNHVLPNIDDGSISMEMSLSMLENAANQGITDVVNTVHYQHPKVDKVDTSFERIIREIEKLQSALDGDSIPIKLHIGSEVFYLPNLLSIIDDPITTIGNGRYMLVEFLPNHIPETHKQVFFDLKMSGVTPIIAHPERYKPIQKDIGLVYNWLNAGCFIQIDAGSILGLFGRESKNAAELIVKNSWCQIMGSDAHNNRNRNFILNDAYNIVQDWVGDDANYLVYDNPKAILEGEDIRIKIEENIHVESKFWNKFKIRKR